MSDEIRYDNNSQRAGRWATATSLFAAFEILMCLAFADKVAVYLGIPTSLSFALGGLAGILVLLLNWGIANMKKASYGKLVMAFIAATGVLTALMCAMVLKSQPFSNQTLGSVAIYVGLFLITMLLALRLKHIVTRV